ncbi:MAG: HoxN/HupN/NixA family nickel/cobalt transporter, partial [Caldimonas sp.]
ALVIGSIELLQVFINLLDLRGHFFDFVAALDFGVMGYIIVGLFLCCWALSVALWKYGGLEERCASVEPMHAHEHSHDGLGAHTHEHIH